MTCKLYEFEADIFLFSNFASGIYQENPMWTGEQLIDELGELLYDDELLDVSKPNFKECIATEIKAIESLAPEGEPIAIHINRKKYTPTPRRAEKALIALSDFAPINKA